MPERNADTLRRSIRDTMTYIDMALLNLTEWFCHKFQLLTGRTNVWLAVQFTNLSIIVYFMGAGVYFLSSDVVPRVALALFCGGLLYVLTQTVFKVPIEAYENNAYRRVAKGLRNPRRVRDVLLRISFLTMAFVLFYPLVFVYLHFRVPAVLLLSYSLIVLTTVVLYLLACDPLPPSADRSRVPLRRPAPSAVAASEAPGVRSHSSRRAALPPAPGPRSRCRERDTSDEAIPTEHRSA